MKLTFYNDPGHGWLSVSHEQIRQLGIADQISHYSYMNSTRVYLEEDVDAPLFLAAAFRAGWKVTIKDKYVEKTFIRNLAHCDGSRSCQLQNKY